MSRFISPGTNLAVEGRRAFPVEFDPLQQRAGAVPDAGHRDPDLPHALRPRPSRLY